MEALFLGFWTEVMLDLLEGDEETRCWLDTGAEQAGFLWWAEVTNKQPQEWRKSLLGLWAMHGTRQGTLAKKKIQKQVME